MGPIVIWFPDGAQIFPGAACRGMIPPVRRPTRGQGLAVRTVDVGVRAPRHGYSFRRASKDSICDWMSGEVLNRNRSHITDHTLFAVSPVGRRANLARHLTTGFFYLVAT
jgi:hypothetical protein